MSHSVVEYSDRVLRRVVYQAHEQLHLYVDGIVFVLL